MAPRQKSMQGANINNFGGVALRLSGANRRLTAILAQEGAVRAQENAPVDTGFYRDNIVALTPGSPGVSGATETRINREGRQVQRTSNATSGTRIDTAAILGLADYSIYVELRDAPIYRAAESLRKDFPSSVEQVRREFDLGD